MTIEQTISKLKYLFDVLLNQINDIKKPVNEKNVNFYMSLPYNIKERKINDKKWVSTTLIGIHTLNGYGYNIKESRENLNLNMKEFFQTYITNNIPIPPPNPEDYVVIDESNKEPKFKSGDRIRIKLTNEIGTIKGFTTSNINQKNMYMLKLDKNNGDRYFYEDSLIKVEEEEKFKIGDIVQIDSNTAIHNKKYGIVENHNMHNNHSEVIDLGFTNHVYDYDNIKKIIRCENKNSLSLIGNFIQVRGYRFKFSKRYGFIIMGDGCNNFDIDFGDSIYIYNLKNLKIIKGN